MEITKNADLIDHLKDVGMMYGFPVIIVIGLLVWAWKRMETSQDKLEKVVATNITENDKAHGELFKLIRASDEKINTLIGAHDAIQRGGRE